MAKIYNFEVEHHVGEKWCEIQKIIKENPYSNILLTCSMGGGKTELAVNDFYNDFTLTENIHLSIGEPTRSCVANVSNRTIKATGKTPFRCDGTVDYIELDGELSSGVTTYESAWKIKGACKEKQIERCLILDEIHELPEAGVGFRSKMRQFYNERKNCKYFIGMTATPDNCTGMDWDIIIKVNTKYKKIVIPKLDLVYIEDFKASTIATAIKYVSNLYPDCNYLVSINDKTKMKDVTEMLKGIIPHTMLWYSNMEEGPAKELLDKAMRREEIKMPKLLLTTSVIESGAEILTDPNLILVDFIDNNMPIIRPMQKAGRPRNGNKGAVWFFKKYDKETQRIKSEELIRERITKFAQKTCDFLNEDKKPYIKKGYPHVIPSLNADGLYEYSIDEISIEKEAHMDYMIQYYSNPKELKKYIKNHNAFEVKEIYHSFLTDKDFKEQQKIINERKKEEEEAFKEKIEEFERWVLNEAVHKDLEIITSKLDEIHPRDQWLLDRDIIQRMRDIYYDKLMHDYRSNVKLLANIKQIPKEEALLLAANGEGEEILFEEMIIEACKMYNVGMRADKTATKKMKYFNTVCAIHKKVEKLGNGKERDVVLNPGVAGGNFDKLYDYLKNARKRSNLLTVSRETLKKLLQFIYNIKQNNQISSTKKY